MPVTFGIAIDVEILSSCLDIGLPLWSVRIGGECLAKDPEMVDWVSSLWPYGCTNPMHVLYLYVCVCIISIYMHVLIILYNLIHINTIQYISINNICTNHRVGFTEKPRGNEKGVTQPQCLRQGSGGSSQP